MENLLTSKDEKIASLNERIETLNALLQKQESEKELALAKQETALEAANSKIREYENELKKGEEKNAVIQRQVSDKVTLIRSIIRIVLFSWNEQAILRKKNQIDYILDTHVHQSELEAF